MNQKELLAFAKEAAKSMKTEKDFSDFSRMLKYARGFVSCSARATNEHRHKTNLAYMIDLYMVPTVKRLIESRGVTVDQDQYALSALVQWIFRSAIRDGKPITLLIPSERMRGLLLDWLNPKPLQLAITA
jgi:hypothetical protein